MNDTLPPPPMYGMQLAIIVIPYSLIFTVGIIGNTAVLTYALFITRSLRSSVLALGNTFLYIVALSMVDMMVIFSIPFHMTTIVLDNWLYGEFVCKVYWILETSNKICSTFIMTAMAFDRYMAICYPGVARIHRMKQTLCIIFGLLFIALTLLLPVFYFAGVVRYSFGEKYIAADGTQTTIAKDVCTDGLKHKLRMWVAVYVFLFGFLIPGTLLTFFYSNMILRLRKQSRALMQSRIPIRRVTIYTLAVSVFYFICQTPFWVTQMYGTFLSFSNKQSPPQMVLVTYVCHMFPFIAAAFNWIFYAQLNTQFRSGLALVSERIRRQTISQYSSFHSMEQDVLLGDHVLYMNKVNKKNNRLTVNPPICTKCGNILHRNSRYGNGFF